MTSLETTRLPGVFNSTDLSALTSWSEIFDLCNNPGITFLYPGYINENLRPNSNQWGIVMIIRHNDSMSWLNHTVIYWLVWDGVYQKPMMYVGGVAANNANYVVWECLNNS